MSSSGSRIACRRCGEEFPTEDGSCPHCGKSVRNVRHLVGGVILGFVLAVASLSNLDTLAVFGALGVAIAGASGYLLYNKRQRIKEASGTGSESEIPETSR